MEKIIVLEDLNFQWDTEMANTVTGMWQNGTSFYDIAKATKRKKEEVFLLLMDLSMKGKIKKRKGFLNGGNVNE